MNVALITGASQGFGRALGRGLIDRGWSLVIDARGAEALSQSESELGAALTPGARLAAIPGDVADPAHRRALLAACGELGGLDLLVNNASSLGPTPLPHLAVYPIGDLRRVVEVDTIAPLALMQEALGQLRRSSHPRVLNITSDASAEHYEGWGGYGLAKAALDHMSLTFAVEEPDLRVWVVDPGDMRTAMHQDAFPGEDISDRPLPDEIVPAFLALIDSGTPSGRYRASELISTAAGR
ncbi:MAG: SDR family NAD(P)-dependent oxidoreductase [Acidimicrobiales bacterium]